MRRNASASRSAEQCSLTSATIQDAQGGYHGSASGRAAFQPTQQEAWAALKTRIAELSALIGHKDPASDVIASGSAPVFEKAALPPVPSDASLDQADEKPFKDPGRPPSGLRSVSKGPQTQGDGSHAGAPTRPKLPITLSQTDTTSASAPADAGDLLEARLHAIRRAHQEADDSNTVSRI
jgi:hypothetical protein